MGTEVPSSVHDVPLALPLADSWRSLVQLLSPPFLWRSQRLTALAAHYRLLNSPLNVSRAKND